MGMTEVGYAEFRLPCSAGMVVYQMRWRPDKRPN